MKKNLDEGEEEQLKKFIEWCKKGPPRAVVTDVKFSVGEIKKKSSFEIRR